MQEQTTTPAKQYAIVELMGHQRLAGQISQENFGGSTFIRIDVPEIRREGKPTIQAYTKLQGPASIYAITFVDQSTAELAASQIRAEPYTAWELKRALQALPAGNSGRSDMYENEEDY